MTCLIRAGLGTILATVSLAALAQQPAQPNVESGKQIFVSHGCYECHGYAGQGGAAGAQLVPVPLDAKFLISYVRHPTGQMPMYTEKVISDRQLTDVWAYLQTLPVPRRAGEIHLLANTRPK